MAAYGTDNSDALMRALRMKGRYEYTSLGTVDHGALWFWEV